MRQHLRNLKSKAKGRSISCRHLKNKSARFIVREELSMQPDLTEGGMDRLVKALIRFHAEQLIR